MSVDIRKCAEGTETHNQNGSQVYTFEYLQKYECLPLSRNKERTWKEGHPQVFSPIDPLPAESCYKHTIMYLLR